MSEGISGWAIGALAKTLFSKVINALPAFALRRLVSEAEFKNRVMIAFDHTMPVAWLNDGRPSHGISGWSLLVANQSPAPIKVSLVKVSISNPPQNLLTQTMSEFASIQPNTTAELSVAELTLTDQQVRFLINKRTKILHINIRCYLKVESPLHSYSAEVSKDLNVRIEAPVKRQRR